MPIIPRQGTIMIVELSFKLYNLRLNMGIF